MLAIRYQRTGRKGHAQFRVIVQDSRRSPSSGQLVAQIGHVDPHTKAVTLDKERAKFYLDNGAQPSDRVARMLKSEGVKLPSWVSITNTQKRAIKNPEKLRKNRPAGAPEPEKAPIEAVEEPAVEEVVAAAPADEPAEQADQTAQQEPTETEASEETVEAESEAPAKESK